MTREAWGELGCQVDVALHPHLDTRPLFSSSLQVPWAGQGLPCVSAKKPDLTRPFPSGRYTPEVPGSPAGEI